MDQNWCKGRNMFGQ